MSTTNQISGYRRAAADRSTGLGGFTFEFGADGALKGFEYLQANGIVAGNIDNNGRGCIWGSRLVPAKKHASQPLDASFPNANLFVHLVARAAGNRGARIAWNPNGNL